jgi:hypothetical protein
VAHSSRVKASSSALTGHAYAASRSPRYRSRRYTPCSVSSIGVPYVHLAANATDAARPLVTAWLISPTGAGRSSGRSQCSRMSRHSEASSTDGVLGMPRSRQARSSQPTASSPRSTGCTGSVWLSAHSSRSAAPNGRTPASGSASSERSSSWYASAPCPRTRRPIRRDDRGGIVHSGM